MEEAQTAQAPDVSMTDSVIGGDVSTTNIHITQNYGIQWSPFAFVAAALILCSVGMMTDAWAVQEESVTVEVLGVEVTTTVEIEVGLDDITTSTCSGGECEVVDQDLGTMSDNCTDQAEKADLTEEQTEEACGDIQDSANAGLIAMIFITLGIIVLLLSIVSTLIAAKGILMPSPQTYPFVGSTLILIGIISWYLILPEGDSNLGYSGRLTISGIIVSSMAGIQLSIVHKFDKATKTRRPGLGVRTLVKDSSAREFVIRETGSGNQTLSIIEDSILLRLTKSIRSGDVTSTEDLFVTKIDALLGFTHTRYDWLDKTKYLWNIFALAGLVLTIVDGSLAYALIFAVGLCLTLLQFADPELIVFETNSGKHRLFIFRAGSNRLLTDISMEHIDSVMREMLSGEKITTTKIDDAAQQIEDNLADTKSAEASKQAAILEAQANAQAQMQAQEAMQAQQATPPPSAAPAPVPPAIQPQTPAPTILPPSAATAPMPPVIQPQNLSPTTPPPDAIPPITNPPPATPAPMPPPQVNAPLPPLPPNLDPGLVSGMGIPTETIGDAPEVPMQAAPRDESLSEGEKEDLLSDLDDD